MIDDEAEVKELMREMEAHLPIPASPGEALIAAMNRRGVRLAPSQELPIKSVLYAGDEGGIMCDVTPPGQKDPILCSLTHIHVSASHPLGEAIRAYQEKRTRRLARGGALREPASFTLQPRKRRGR